MFGKPDVPDNCFTVSMIPWVSFEGFNLNLQKGYDYLLLIFTMRKYYEEMTKISYTLLWQIVKETSLPKIYPYNLVLKDKFRCNS